MKRIWFGRRVGPEKNLLVAPLPALHVEGIHQLAGGVVLGDPQSLEIVVVELHFRPLDDRVSLRDEGVDDVPLRLGNRMAPPGGERTRREGDVDTAERLSGPDSRFRELGNFRAIRLLELGLESVRGLDPPSAARRSRDRRESGERRQSRSCGRGTRSSSPPSAARPRHGPETPRRLGGFAQFFPERP